MTAPILMPKLGLTMTEGTLSAWNVAPGDTVAAGDVLFVVETEKIATDVEAQAAGRIDSILVPAGEVVPVGTTVATLATEGAAASAAIEPHGIRVIATPLARRRAREAGIALSDIPGSGPRRRVKVADVESALAKRSSAPPPSPAASPAATRRQPNAVERITARRLAEAKRTIPHFYVQAEADVTALLALRAELNALPGATRLSLTHFVVAAVGRALRSMPEANLVWADDAFLELAGIDVGVVVDTPRGLLVPVLRGAGAMTVGGIASGMDALVPRARAGHLEAEDLEGGAISVSNVGMFGASYLTPIVNPGQSAILGVAAVRPVFRPDAAGQPALRQELGLVLSCDHRVWNGVRGARFLDHVTRILSKPLALLRA